MLYAEGADKSELTLHYTSKSVCYEVAHLFVAHDLQAVPAHEVIPDDTEFLEVGILSFDDVLQMVLYSEIRDAMTVIAVLWVARSRRLLTT